MKIRTKARRAIHVLFLVSFLLLIFPLIFGLLPARDAYALPPDFLTAAKNACALSPSGIRFDLFRKALSAWTADEPALRCLLSHADPDGELAAFQLVCGGFSLAEVGAYEAYCRPFPDLCGSRSEWAALRASQCAQLPPQRTASVLARYSRCLVLPKPAWVRGAEPVPSPRLDPGGKGEIRLRYSCGVECYGTMVLKEGLAEIDLSTQRGFAGGRDEGLACCAPVEVFESGSSPRSCRDRGRTPPPPPPVLATPAAPAAAPTARPNIPVSAGLKPIPPWTESRIDLPSGLACRQAIDNAFDRFIGPPPGYAAAAGEWSTRKGVLLFSASEIRFFDEDRFPEANVLDEKNERPGEVPAFWGSSPQDFFLDSAKGELAIHDRTRAFLARFLATQSIRLAEAAAAGKVPRTKAIAGLVACEKVTSEARLAKIAEQLRKRLESGASVSPTTPASGAPSAGSAR